MGGRGGYKKMGGKNNPYRNMSAAQVSNTINQLNSELTKFWGEKEVLRNIQAGLAWSPPLSFGELRSEVKQIRDKERAVKDKIAQAKAVKEYRETVRTRQEVRKESAQRRQQAIERIRREADAQRRYGFSLF